MCFHKDFYPHSEFFLTHHLFFFSLFVNNMPIIKIIMYAIHEQKFQIIIDYLIINYHLFVFSSHNTFLNLILFCFFFYENLFFLTFVFAHWMTCI